jgi:hypothetical protein
MKIKNQIEETPEEEVSEEETSVDTSEKEEETE